MQKDDTCDLFQSIPFRSAVIAKMLSQIVPKITFVIKRRRLGSLEEGRKDIEEIFFLLINKKDHQFIYVSPSFACDLIQCVANLTVFAFGIYS